MEVLSQIRDALERLRAARSSDTTVGFVPTMGALHAGHLSLVGRARAENDLVVASIFVNPTQYDDPGDLERYPRPFEDDLAACEAAGVDLVLAPDYDALYPDDYRFKVSESVLSRELEGAHRDGHFDRAYFGEKDWQQLQLVSDMADAFFLNTEIVACPTVREPDGLAMSSRNALLEIEDRRKAPRFHEVLSSGLPVERMTAELESAGFDVDYVERRRDRVLGAVRLGKVRLIDNVEA
jgi:pantoate--beta-alanine ligase